MSIIIANFSFYKTKFVSNKQMYVLVKLWPTAMS